MADTIDDRRDPDLNEHYATYRGFKNGVLLFALHALVILGLLAYFFA